MSLARAGSSPAFGTKTRSNRSQAEGQQTGAAAGENTHFSAARTALDLDPVSSV